MSGTIVKTSGVEKIFHSIALLSFFLRLLYVTRTHTNVRAGDNDVNNCLSEQCATVKVTKCVRALANINDESESKRVIRSSCK